MIIKLIVFVVIFLLVQFSIDDHETRVVFSAALYVSLLLLVSKKIKVVFSRAYSISHFKWLTIYLFPTLFFLIVYQVITVSLVYDGNFLEYKPVFSITETLLMVLFVILEELTFREFFLREIRKTKSEIFSVMIVSVFFSLAHLNTDSGLLPVFIGSLIISRLYLKSNSILNAIVLHLFINISNFFVFQLFANFPELILMN